MNVVQLHLFYFTTRLFAMHDLSLCTRSLIDKNMVGHFDILCIIGVLVTGDYIFTLREHLVMFYVKDTRLI